MQNQIMINVHPGETRVALLENSTFSELHVERKDSASVVGNVVKGRVSRVLPGMQAAFVDIGLEKAAFLYVGDYFDNTAPDEDVVVDLNSALMWQLRNWGYNSSNGWAGDNFYGGNHPGPITTPCNESYGGYADWRMPSLSEMASLMSFAHSSPTWPTEVFEDPLYGEIFWTTTRKMSNNTSDADDYWMVDFDWGHIYTQDGPTGSAKIKCVRP